MNISTAPPSPSPRPSFSTLLSPTSSTRTSIDVPATNSAQSSLLGVASTTPTITPRRHRAALRDYYNIKANAANAANAATSEPTEPLNPQDQSPLAALDAPGFEAGAYVRRLLEEEGLDGVLRVERELVGEIRGLDGERKGLVYDNYSKLIRATDTIRKMRTNMDPLAPATSTLAPAISHIADTAAALSTQLAAHVAPPKNIRLDQQKEKQRQTVRWVLNAPKRMKQTLEDGDREAAEADWKVVQGLLERWKDVPGVEGVKRDCEEVMGTGDTS